MCVVKCPEIRLIQQTGTGHEGLWILYPEFDEEQIFLKIVFPPPNYRMLWNVYILF